MKYGGYNEGYSTCDYFWGKHPAKYVQRASEMLQKGRSVYSLDFGCGDGKNSSYLDSLGFNVTAIDISKKAIENANRLWNCKNVEWINSDIRTYMPKREEFDLVLATGSPHCLKTEDEVSQLIEKMKKVTRKGGYVVLSAFNDGENDFNGHEDTFLPILLSHEWYLEQFTDFEILESSDVFQGDTHPNNGIEHTHSITRILAQKQ